MTAQTKSTLILLFTAFIWGTAFVAQKEGGDALGPYTFVFLRFAIGSLSLVPAIAVLDRLGLTERRPSSREEWLALLRAGGICGLFIAGTTIFQQLGLWLGTEAGKSGFITSLYILVVPMLGLFAGRRCGANVWLSAAAAAAGLYLLCGLGELSLRPSDGVTLLCTLAASFHILAVDRFANRVDVVRMSMIQFAATSVIALPLALIFEAAPDPASWAARLASPGPWYSLLYTGVLSSGVAYTLQCVGQKGSEPSIASLVMSFESVFAALAGAAVLGERLTGRELAGCAIIFAALIFAQLPSRKVRPGPK